MLALSGEQRTERQVLNWVLSGKISLISGDLEVVLLNMPSWRPGGQRRWEGTKIPSGYILVSQLASDLHISRPSVYYHLRKEDIPLTRHLGRAIVSLQAVARLQEVSGITSDHCYSEIVSERSTG